MDDARPLQPSDASPPRWRPLDRVERRVLGVLIEKAKTTPDTYPLSLNALKSGCNQKSNRFPSMQLEEDEVEETIERLREAGAVVVIQGGARVDKYRHLAYEWLSVSKVELAVMGELLLRGAQTIGELRGRAARMEPIKDLGDLRPILESLQAKNLILYLTPEGRGAVVTHNLYQSHELEKLRREYGSPSRAGAGSTAAPSSSSEPAPERAPERNTAAGSASTQPIHFQPPAGREVEGEMNGLADELEQLRKELSATRAELSTFRAETTSVLSELRQQIDDVNQQLGNL